MSFSRESDLFSQNVCAWSSKVCARVVSVLKHIQHIQHASTRYIAPPSATFAREFRSKLTKRNCELRKNAALIQPSKMLLFKWTCKGANFHAKCNDIVVWCISFPPVALQKSANTATTTRKWKQGGESVTPCDTNMGDLVFASHWLCQQDHSPFSLYSPVRHRARPRSR